SVHSGSDKFSVFPYVGKECRGKFHLKTSGTSWVEALRVVAMCEPNLFRRMLKYSCIHFEEAQKSYHVTAQVENVPDIDKLSDQELPALMDLKDTRQVMHITYGFLLQSRGETGAYLFRDELYEALDKNEALLQTVVSAHIRKHLHYLGLC
ncbi:MAG: tagaturonate epimerase family protein, partial [Oscillospiraceae bacterium]|nr:tagaturonate epimerase family protein [Oscillospiraceae bacterium]